MKTVSEKIQEILNRNGVRSSYPEKLKEELRTLVIEECKKIAIEASKPRKCKCKDRCSEH